MQITQTPSNATDGRRPVRIWVDGCFDMTHYGHFNALRQAKAMGDYLVVGVHSDEEILKNKGPTVMKEEERYAVVRSCKWVDEVVPNAPYYTTVAMLDKYNCDFCVHGDDITTTADGTDCYQEVKQAGRYKECKRTPGISTTELVGRMLLMTTDHHQRSNNTDDGSSAVTARRIMEFSGNAPQPRSGDRIVYVDGGFDLFHLGHIELLKAAKALGDFLVVGVHDDRVINRIRGCNYPVMNVHERVLSVLACKCVDDVIIGAPYAVTKAFFAKLPYKVDVVVHGKTAVLPDVDGTDPYAWPKQLGLYQEVETPYAWMSTDSVIDRIVKNRRLYEERNRRKLEKAALEQQLEAQEKATDK